MQNPFPGMNPYLENPDRWRTVHNRLIARIDDALSEVLPEGFASFIEERVYIEGWAKDFYPDVFVVERPLPRGSNSTAILERPDAQSGVFDQPIRLDVGENIIHETFVEIRTTDDNEEVIAAIEVLSPTNKTPGPGRDEYVRKQRQFTGSLVHFLEIDLLRAGAYSVAPPEQIMRTRTGNFDYIVSLHRGGAGRQFEVWPVRLRERLPRICLPLTEAVGDVYLDLQAILNRVYEGGKMHRTTRYDIPLSPPLSDDDAAWAQEVLRQAGIANPVT